MILSKEFLNGYFYKKNVMIIGSAPCCVDISANMINSYDIVIRLNNYKFFNESKKINIFYSYFGRNIRKTKEDIIKDKIDFIMCKYPKSNWGKRIDGHQDNWGEVYEYRKDYFPISYYIPSDIDFKENYNILKRIPSTGVSCILDVLRFKPLNIFICGFDFFKSKIHNIDEKWDCSGNHDTIAEKILITKLFKNGKINISERMINLCVQVQ